MNDMLFIVLLVTGMSLGTTEGRLLLAGCLVLGIGGSEVVRRRTRKRSRWWWLAGAGIGVLANYAAWLVIATTWTWG